MDVLFVDSVLGDDLQTVATRERRQNGYRVTALVFRAQRQNAAATVSQQAVLLMRRFWHSLRGSDTHRGHKSGIPSPSHATLKAPQANNASKTRNGSIHHFRRRCRCRRQLKPQPLPPELVARQLHRTGKAIGVESNSNCCTGRQYGTAQVQSQEMRHHSSAATGAGAAALVQLQASVM